MQQSVVEFLKSIITALDWSDWVTSIATFILAILTFVYVRLTSRILSSQSDPCVVLTVVHDKDRPTILQLVARNIGSGLAKDIRFTFSHSLPAKAFGITGLGSKKVQNMTDGPLINGIPALGPGERREVDWGQYGGLKEAIGDNDIIATCHFKKDSKKMNPITCPLSVDSFYGTVAAESPALKTAKELEKISKFIGHVASGSRKLKVEVTSMPEEKETGNNAIVED